MLHCDFQSRKSGDGNVGILRLAGTLTIEYAERLREALLAALEESVRLTLDCSEVTDVDLSGLQLLCSAHRTASSGRHQLELLLPMPAALHRAFNEVGLVRLRACCSVAPGTPCLWQDRNA